MKEFLDKLTPKQKEEARKYLSSQGVTKPELHEAISLHPSKGVAKEYLLGQESKEVAEKSLEFEDDTFKIDSTSWKEEIRTVDGENQKVKVSPQGDVLEYLEGPAKGEQLFITYASFINYVAQAKGCSVQEAEQKYLLTKEELQTKMKQVDYKDFYNTQIKGHLAGYWHPYDEECYDVGGWSDVWLAGGHGAVFDQDGWCYGSDCASFGFSGRLLKN